MKTVIRIVFDTYQIPGGAEAVLGQTRLDLDVAEVDKEPILRQLDMWVMLEETDPRLPALFKLLKQHDATWAEDHYDVYTEEELSNARLLLMHPNREIELFGGVEYGTIYDLSGVCRACGTGAKQTSPLFADARKLGDMEGKRTGSTIFWHILVDAGFEAELLRIGATGISFRDVYAVTEDKRQFKIPFRQLCANKTLPPMSPSTTGLVRDRACEVCGRNGYFETSKAPTRIVYRASDLRDADDVNMSWENIGYAMLEPELKDSLLSYPWMVVTPKVRRVFVDAGVTCFDWIPIRVEEG